MLHEIYPGSFRVADVAQTMGAPAEGANRDSQRLRSSLPDFLAEAADRSGGSFQNQYRPIVLVQRENEVDSAREGRPATLQAWIFKRTGI